MLELIGRYRIHEQIGEGAMADVYRAHDPHIDRPLAVKVLKAEFREHAEYAARFLREARAAGALSHRGIVTVYDVGEVDGFPFIVMELLDGEPLSDTLKRGALQPSQVIGIGLQLADALAYAHGQGVIHRDIKPSNIMLSPDGTTIKLLDFGIAQLAEADPLFEEQSFRTQIGQVIGTPRYMSPEQALGQEMDARSDLYSVGVVLYEMLSGRRAFAGGSVATLTAQIVNTDPAPLAEVAPNVPRGIQFIVHKAMAKQPAQRFADANRLADALRREVGVANILAKEQAAERRYLSLPLRLTILMALITAAVLAAAVGTVLVRQRDAMRQVALTSGSVVSAFVANNAALRAADNAALPPDQQDWVPVQAFVRNAAADPNLRGLTVVDAGGVVRAATDAARVGRPYAAPVGGHAIANRNGIAISTAEDGRSFRFVRPITYAGRRFGQVDLLLDQGELRSAARLSAGLLILLGVVTLGTVALVTYLSTRFIQAPLARLSDGLLTIARGTLDFRISHARRDEFGELFDQVNLIAQSMGERLNAVEALVLDRDVPGAAPPDAALEPPPIPVISAHQPRQPDPTPAPVAAPPPPPPPPPAPAPAPAVDEAPAPPPPAPTAPEPSPAKAEPDRVEASTDERPAPPLPVGPPEAPSTAPAAPDEDMPVLDPPWPHDADEDRTVMDEDDHSYR